MKNKITSAIVGLSVGFFLQSCEKKAAETTPLANGDTSNAIEQMSPLTQSFYHSLSEKHQKMFLELDVQHRQMAMDMCQQSCNGKNKCKGLGGCKTKDHSCRGQNSCKGQGGTPVTNPNQCVEVQYERQG